MCRVDTEKRSGHNYFSRTRFVVQCTKRFSLSLKRSFVSSCIACVLTCSSGFYFMSQVMFQQINGPKKRDSDVLFTFCALWSLRVFCVYIHVCVCPVINRWVVYEVLRWLFLALTLFLSPAFKSVKVKTRDFVCEIYLYDPLFLGHRKQHQLRESVCTLKV